MSDPQMQPRTMPTATLDVVQGGGSDPMCCPGDLATRRFGLHDGKLVESTPVVSGRLSAASVGAAEWRLVAWDTAEPLTDDVEVSIGFAEVFVRAIPPRRSGVTSAGRLPLPAGCEAQRDRDERADGEGDSAGSGGQILGHDGLAPA